MPSFLSKVFGRKKDDRDPTPTNQLGPGELLGGKFEAISPNVSPSATRYLELQPDATKVPADADAGRIINDEKEFGLPFFRTKSRPSSPEVKPKRLFDTLPPLSLDFDDLKDKSAFNGYIFEESNSEAIFSDNVLGQRRLNPLEALVLIRACSKAISSRGLEALGIMTPHWYSASPDVQRGLISKFLRSLDLTRSTEDTIPNSPYITNFEDEVNFTRSIHDVAAVFRWGLRHVQLEGDSFGADEGWYKAFLNAEAANDYPPKAFSEKLAPSLPASHLDLVISTLEVFSSLAAFSELNSTSGSKLSKMFGLWLLTARRVEHKDDWRTIYARWERTGRMLEHLFLARIRDQSTDQRMPTRLLELVRNYPFTHGLSPPTTDLQLLPYPQFTTPLHHALLVRVQYEVTAQEHIPKTKINPSVLLADALSTKVEEGEFVEVWAKITTAASMTGSELPLGNVLANESLRLMSLVADMSTEEVKSPTFSVFSLVEHRHLGATSSSGVSPLKPSTESAPLTTTAPLSPIGSDWEQFSASGFLGVDQTFPPLVSTLFDTDVEKTEPRDLSLPISRKSSRRAGRKSLELPRSIVITDSTGNSFPEAANSKSSPKARQEVITASELEVIELDEAFIDFWSDALLDPIVSDWPAFVVCKFKPSLVPDLTFGTGDEATTKTLKWLVLEQVYNVKPRPVPSSPLTTLPTPAETSTRPASPIAQSPSGRRLFNFWSVSRTPSSSSTSSQKTKKTLKTPKVGEMGELIEEDEDKKDVIRVKFPGSKKFRSLDLPVVRKLAGKKSDAPEEKATSSDVTRPEIPATDLDARATSSSIVAASAVVAADDVASTTTAVVGLLTTEKQEISTALEAVAESSEPVLVSESTDDAPKQYVVPVEAEITLADVEKTDVPTLDAAVPKQDSQIIDAAADNEPAIPSVPETTIVADKRQPEEPSKDESGTTIEEAVARQNVDHPLPASTSAESSSNQPLLSEVELPVQKDGDVEQTIRELDVTDQPVLDEVTVVSEECQAPLMTGEDEQVKISEATREEVGGVSAEPELGGVKEDDLEALSLTEEETTLVVSAVPEIETQVTELDSKINEHDVNEAVAVVEVKPEAISTLSVVDEVSAMAVEEVGTDHETYIPTLSVAEPTPIVVDELIVVDEPPAVEAYPELDERGPSIEEVSNSITIAPTEVEGAVADGAPAAVEDMEVDKSFVGVVSAPGDSSSAIVDRIIVEEVLPTAESPAVIEVPLISSDASVSAAATQTTPALPVGGEIAVPQEVSLEVAGAAGGAPIEDSLAVEADSIIETISEAIAAETSSAPAIDEPQGPEAPIETAVKEPEPLADAPVQELSGIAVEIVNPQEEATETTASEPLEQLTTEHPIIVDESSVEGPTAAGEGAPVDETIVLEERGQDAPAVESEAAAEAVINESVHVGIPETQPISVDEGPVSEESLKEPPIDVARETSASEDVPPPIEALILETPITVESEPEVPPADPTSERPSWQPIIVGSEESTAPEAVPAAEEPNQELPAFKEETPIQIETEETPFVQPPTNEPHEESAIETELSATGAALERVPTEVLQVVEEPEATNEAPMAEHATFENEEAEISGAGESSVPEEQIRLEGPEHLEAALPTTEDACAEDVAVDKPSPILEVTPPDAESLTDSRPAANDRVTATSEEVKVAEETVVVEEVVEDAPPRIAEITTEIKTSDEPPESITAFVPEVSQESLPVTEDVTAEETVPSVVPEQALGEVPSEAQALAQLSAAADIPQVVEDSLAIIEETDEAVNADGSIDVAEEAVPPLPGSVEEPLLAEPPTIVQETLTTVEQTRTEESPAPSDEPVHNAEVSAVAEQPSPREESLNVADDEKNTPSEASIPFGKPPLVVTIPEEESVEKTFVVDGIAPHAVELPIPLEEVPVMSDDAEQPAATAAAIEASPEVVPRPDTETAAEPPETFSAPELASETSEREDNTPHAEVPADIDQPVEHPAIEEGIIDEPIVDQSAPRDDLSVENPDEQTIPDTPLASPPTDIPSDACEAELAHVDNRNEEDDAPANTPDPTIAATTSISEKEPMETLADNISPSIMDPCVVELHIVPVSLAEPSLGSADPAPTKQSEWPVEDTPELPAIPEHIDVAPLDTNQPAILDEVNEVPTFVEDSAEPSEEHVVSLEESELASQLPNGDGHVQIATEATDTTIVAPDVGIKAVVDESVTSKPSVNTSLENLKDNVAMDVEATQEADPITTAEAQ